MTPVPSNEISHLLSVRSKYNEVSVGTWARVKSGKYKGDLAQVLWICPWTELFTRLFSGYYFVGLNFCNWFSVLHLLFNDVFVGRIYG